MAYKIIYYPFQTYSHIMLILARPDNAKEYR